MPDTPMTAAPAGRPRSYLRWRARARALRAHQWVKNLLLFVPVVLDHRLHRDARRCVRAALAFAAFCCAASGAYILNDLLDLEADRRHRDQAPSAVRVGTVPARARAGCSPRP